MKKYQQYFAAIDTRLDQATSLVESVDETNPQQAAQKLTRSILYLDAAIDAINELEDILAQHRRLMFGKMPDPSEGIPDPASE